MSPEQQIDRSVLAGKDREELHTIAGAMGVRAATRMRKADLIDAILAAANGDGAGNGDAEAKPLTRRVRSTATNEPVVRSNAAAPDASKFRRFGPRALLNDTGTVVFEAEVRARKTKPPSSAAWPRRERNSNERENINTRSSTTTWTRPWSDCCKF